MCEKSEKKEILQNSDIAEHAIEEKIPSLMLCYLRIILGIAFLFALLFACAGTLNWLSGWFFFGISSLGIFASVPLMYKYNPQMLTRKFPKDTKTFDKIFLVIYVPLFYSEMIIGGLDERYDLSGDFILPLIIAGTVVYGVAFVLWLWSVATNKNFEITVRIQKDRGHTVCETGPYGFVRHPAYVAGILMFVSTPFALSTLWGLIPGGVLVIALIIRTVLEDRMLRKELKGYEEFTNKTKFRLIPKIW
ncbi:MAG: isoprenylcysteine carboxylmethyltransferase family protein [Planctomycetes bacterium]|nr:isoprenylcysteine carboxylmethyltransferase family protein [Planctomycetota bacterium]